MQVKVQILLKKSDQTARIQNVTHKAGGLSQNDLQFKVVGKSRLCAFCFVHQLVECSLSLLCNFGEKLPAFNISNLPFS